MVIDMSFVESGVKEAAPEIRLNPVMFSRAPALVKREVPFVNNDPSDKLRLATCADVELSKLKVLVAAPVISRVVSPPVNGTLVSEIVKSLKVLAPLKV